MDMSWAYSRILSVFGSWIPWSTFALRPFTKPSLWTWHETRSGPSNVANLPSRVNSESTDATLKPLEIENDISIFQWYFKHFKPIANKNHICPNFKYSGFSNIDSICLFAHCSHSHH